MTSASDLPSYAAALRRHDPDRFFTALFAPPARRNALFLLYAFNHELARAREVAHEPTLALIRLHWWREVVEGALRRHEVAGPLAAALADGTLPRCELAEMIDGREAETEPSLATQADWSAYLLGTAGALAAAAGHALGADGPTQARLRLLGAAYGVAGQLRSVASLARQGRCQLPLDLLGAHGLTPEAVMAAPEGPALRPVLAELARQGLLWQAAGAGRFPRHIIAAALPGVFAGRDLRRLAASASQRRATQRGPAPRGLGDRLAVLAATAIGRIPSPSRPPLREKSTSPVSSTATIPADRR